MRHQNFLLPAIVACLLGCVTGIASGQTTVTFQPGQDGYTGLLDMFIGRHATNGLDSGNANVQGSSVAEFFLDGRYNTSDDTQGLFRFDGIFGSSAGQITLGSRIVSASLELTTSDVDFADSGGPFAVGQLLQSFDTSTTYNGVTEGYRFFSGETGRWMADSFVGPGIDPTLPISANVQQIVQNWASGDANNGFALTSGTTNGWAVYTSGAGDQTLAPKLTVTFDTNPVPPTTQSEYLQSTTDGSNSMFLIDNSGGGAYLNADTSTFVNGNGTYNEANFVDSNGDPAQFTNGVAQEALIRYDNLFVSDGGTIPDDAIIDSAQLLVNTPMYHVDDLANITGASQNYDAGNTVYSLRQVLNDWDGTGTPADLLFGSPVSGQTGMIPDSEAVFDVTSILNNWKNGDGNFGFNLYGSDGTNGWGILNSQAGGAAPRLVVNWRPVPEPGSMALLSGLGLLLTIRRRR